MQQYVVLAVWDLVHESVAREREAEARRERFAAQARSGPRRRWLFRVPRRPRLAMFRPASRTA